jgi:hypothetical protein
LSAKRPIAPRIAQVRIGDEMRVECWGDEWVALDGGGVVGTLRWQAVYDGRPYVNGMMIRFPARGVLRARRLMLGSEG